MDCAWEASAQQASIPASIVFLSIRGQLRYIDLFIPKYRRTQLIGAHAGYCFEVIGLVYRPFPNGVYQPFDEIFDRRILPGIIIDRQNREAASTKIRPRFGTVQERCDPVLIIDL